MGGRRFGKQACQVVAGGEGFEGVGDFGWCGEAVGRVFGQHPVDDGGEFLGDFRPELPDGLDRLGAVGQHLRKLPKSRRLRKFLRPVFGDGKRRPAGEQLVERTAETVDVGTDIDLMGVAGLLGRHVAGRAHDLVRGGQVGIGHWGGGWRVAGRAPSEGWSWRETDHRVRRSSAGPAPGRGS